MEKKLYLVDVVSTFRMRYVVEAHEEEHALDEVVMNEHDNEFQEFSQEHIGTHIFSSREITAIDYMNIFDKDNTYLKDWPDAAKMRFINVVDYKDKE